MTEADPTVSRERSVKWHSPIRCDQSPTSWGWEDVHALGSIVSSVLAKPCMILNPETLAVIEPSVEAARAVVDKWPIEMTEATTSEYSKR